MILDLTILAAVLLVGAAAGLAVLVARPLVAWAQRHRRARLVAEAKRDLRELARHARRARYEVLMRRGRP